MSKDTRLKVREPYVSFTGCLKSESASRLFTNVDEVGLKNRFTVFFDLHREIPPQVTRRRELKLLDGDLSVIDILKKLFKTAYLDDDGLNLVLNDASFSRYNVLSNEKSKRSLGQAKQVKVNAAK